MMMKMMAIATTIVTATSEGRCTGFRYRMASPVR
jgi:hypothetical protein